MLGQEGTVIPLLGERVFGLRGYTAGLAFILGSGLTKAITHYFAGAWSDRYRRKPVLVAVAAWSRRRCRCCWSGPRHGGWVVAARVLIGIRPGLTWSTTVVMEIDLVGPACRGLAMGLNEAAGYAADAATALATGCLAEVHGLRPAPFLIGIAFAALGLGLSTLAVEETREHARLGATQRWSQQTPGDTSRSCRVVDSDGATQRGRAPAPTTAGEGPHARPPPDDQAAGEVRLVR